MVKRRSFYFEQGIMEREYNRIRGLTSVRRKGVVFKQAEKVICKISRGKISSILRNDH